MSILNRPRPRQSLALIDLEGVLMPEMWVAVADHYGIDALRRTTRDEPDYDRLMRDRIAALDRHGITMSAIRGAVEELEPFPGARAFLEELHALMPVAVLSDTFEQIARPLMPKLGRPMLICHSLTLVDDRVVDYELRIADQKARTVAAFQSLNYSVVAAGDSYNDTSMLAKAHTGVLFRAPGNVRAEYPEFPSCTEYEELFRLLTADC